ncbi:thioesterase family protein [Streptomyces sp. A7024]|uniref:Thioesterase family protein n=1 Tax=Streptomyces coryli TaxID=1128680 RepID=A0A6G4TX68_9ACTN|nr:thioesterase family protein [Streptomyces coryli]NGN63708.1 thioesterase family protein [Streptomyces coryli]
MDAFYERVADDRFLSTPYTTGPWDVGAQHAGPPAALLALAAEEAAGRRDELRVARATYEIQRPVPVAPLTVSTRILRDGRSIQLVEATLSPDDGREVMRVTVLRARTSPDSAPTVLSGPEVAGPEGAKDDGFFPVPWEQGYHTAMEVRFTAGSFRELGPATAWFRTRVPLIAGEETTPLTRVLLAADSGNGISGAIDFTRYVFVNADLTVNLHRHPQGEWVCVDARTSVDGSGIGLAESGLHDEKGPLGRGSQTLYVAPRPKG